MMAPRRALLRRAAPLALAVLAAGGAARPGLLVGVGKNAPDAAGGPLARIRSGLVRGRTIDGIHAFLGVPYGRVPGRFRRAEPAAAWVGERLATTFGPVAVQRLGGSVGGAASSEQCLSVNVWTPAGAIGPVAAAGLPVLVWVHGGANVSGASSQPIYDGRHFARSGVVCVTFNYRLGVFGLLELGEVLGSTYAGSGNNALRDQLLLLHWVRDNIAAFGGDPRRITLAGESAGAKDVAALLSAPAARGLFQRAILESGGGRTVLSARQACGVTLSYLDLLGLTRATASRLAGMDPERLIEAQHALMVDPPVGYPLRPVVDGGLLPAMPEVAVSLGSAAAIPILLGTNRDESRLFLGKGAASRPLAARNLSNMDPDGFERLLMRYDAAVSAREGTLDRAELRWRALTAEEYWIPSVRLAEGQSGAGGAVWMYRFDKAAESGAYAGRAAHVSEMPYVWNNPDDPQLAPLIAGFDAALASRMHAAWVSFIAGGVPAAPGLPEWPRYDERTRATMVLNTQSRVEDDPGGAERRLWSSLFLADTSR